MTCGHLYSEFIHGHMANAHDTFPVGAKARLCDRPRHGPILQVSGTRYVTRHVFAVGMTSGLHASFSHAT
jgi:hypothetical protein